MGLRKNKKAKLLSGVKKGRNKRNKGRRLNDWCDGSISKCYDAQTPCNSDADCSGGGSPGGEGGGGEGGGGTCRSHESSYDGDQGYCETMGYQYIDDKCYADVTGYHGNQIDCENMGYEWTEGGMDGGGNGITCHTMYNYNAVNGGSTEYCQFGSDSECADKDTTSDCEDVVDTGGTSCCMVMKANGESCEDSSQCLSLYCNADSTQCEDDEDNNGGGSLNCPGQATVVGTWTIVAQENGFSGYASENSVIIDGTEYDQVDGEFTVCLDYGSHTIKGTDDYNDGWNYDDIEHSTISLTADGIVVLADWDMDKDQATYAGSDPTGKGQQDITFTIENPRTCDSNKCSHKSQVSCLAASDCYGECKDSEADNTGSDSNKVKNDDECEYKDGLLDGLDWDNDSDLQTPNFSNQAKIDKFDMSDISNLNTESKRKKARRKMIRRMFNTNSNSAIKKFVMKASKMKLDGFKRPPTGDNLIQVVKGEKTSSSSGVSGNTLSFTSHGSTHYTVNGGTESNPTLKICADETYTIERASSGHNLNIKTGGSDELTSDVSSSSSQTWSPSTGTFEYYCVSHPVMKGTINVVDCGYSSLTEVVPDSFGTTNPVYVPLEKDEVVKVKVTLDGEDQTVLMHQVSDTKMKVKVNSGTTVTITDGGSSHIEDGLDISFVGSGGIETDIVPGCTDDGYLEYDANANQDDDSCLTVKVDGCTDDDYTEYNPAANFDDGSCATVKSDGCTDDGYLEYSAAANVDDGSCATVKVDGCTDDGYIEYNAAANFDDGTCVTVIVNGCTDSAAFNYNAAANVDDGSCTAVVNGCTDDGYIEYSAAANTDDGSCVTGRSSGCTNILYLEYNAAANADDGSCVTLKVSGCMTSTACNYDASYNFDDGSCYSEDTSIYKYCLNSNAVSQSGVLGCSGSHVNGDGTYSPCSNSDILNANVGGCMDSDANNYDANAIIPMTCSYNCNCANGAGSSDCTATGQSKCYSCNSNFVLDGIACVSQCVNSQANNNGGPAPCTFDYICPNGQPVTPGTGASNGIVKCTSCSVGYAIQSDACFSICPDPNANNHNQIGDCTYDSCADVPPTALCLAADNTVSDDSVCSSGTLCVLGCTEVGNEAYYEDATTNDGTCVPVTDFYLEADPESAPLDQSVWDTKDVACGDQFVSIQMVAGVPELTCRSCTAGNFKLEFTKRQMIAPHRHGKCCVNSHHHVCQQLMNSYKSTCIDDNGKKAHYQGRTC
jgi:plastocyanin